MAGGSQIIINKDGIKIITPAKFEAKAGQHLFKSSERVSTALPMLPALGDKNDYNLRYLLKDKDQNILSHQNILRFSQMVHRSKAQQMRMVIQNYLKQYSQKIFLSIYTQMNSLILIKHDDFLPLRIT